MPGCTVEQLEETNAHGETALQFGQAIIRRTDRQVHLLL